MIPISATTATAIKTQIHVFDDEDFPAVVVVSIDVVVVGLVVVVGAAVVVVGGAVGITEFEADDAGLEPWAFTATTVKEYAVFGARPLTTHAVVCAMHCDPPGAAVTV